MSTVPWLAVLMLAGAADGPDSPPELLTKGKLEFDLGRYDPAAVAFEAVTRHPASTDAQRWESLVRLGLARRGAGDYRGAMRAFEEMWQSYGTKDPEALRFLVLAEGGAVPGAQRWEEIWIQVALVRDDSDPERPRLRVVWPGVPAGARRYTGHAISLDLKDANLFEVFRLFADIAELNVVVHPGVNGRVTMRCAGMPWDEALERMLAPNGLGYRLSGNVLWIARTSDLGEARSYGGARIDVDVKEEPLVDVLQGLGRRGGTSVRVADGIAGRVTIKLQDVPWDQALDVIVRTNGLGWKREGTFIRVYQAPKKR